MLRLHKLLLATAPYLPAILILVGVVALQVFALPGNDVAWLLTLAEKYLAGARPDVDFIEFNPPAAYLIYIPAVAIARVLHIKSDLAAIMLTAVAAVGSIGAAGSILARSGLLSVSEQPGMAAGAIVALLLFADSSFAQREHLALIALLPMLAVYASRATLNAPSKLAAALAGIAGGLAVCIKPYIGFALALPLLYCAWRPRERAREAILVLVSPENISAAVVAAVYGTTIIFFFTDYIRLTLPMVLAVYLPNREPVLAMLTGIRFETFLLMSGAVVAVGGRKALEPISVVLCLAAAGFLLAMFTQARTWFYLGYPALALLMIATAWLILQRAKELPRIGGAKKIASLTIIIAGLLPSIGTLVPSHFYWYAETVSRIRLIDGIRPIVPDHPRVIAISRRYSFVPVARRLDGIWVGRTYFQIITLNVNEQLAHNNVDGPARARLEAYARYDADILATDIISQRPDVILVDGTDDRSWAMSDRAVMMALRNYKEVGFAERAFVWVPAATQRTATTGDSSRAR